MLKVGRYPPKKIQSSHLKSYFLLFLDMVRYGNDFEKRKRIQFQPRIKLIHNRYISLPTQGIYGPLLHFDCTIGDPVTMQVEFDFLLCILAFLDCQPPEMYCLSRASSGIASFSLQRLHDAKFKSVQRVLCRK